MDEMSWHCVVGEESWWCAAGERIHLRTAASSDAEELFACRRAPASQAYVSRLLHSAEEARELIRRQRADDHAVRCVIEYEGRVIGDIGGSFHRPGSLGDEPDVWDFKLGYCVDPDHWGHGFATEAVGLFVPMLHERFGVRRIVGMVFEDNVASARVLTKVGFRLEGTEIAAVLGRDGRWLNDCTFAHLGQLDTARAAGQS